MESINKQNLAAKIRQLEGLSAEEKGELLRLLQQRRYGLIWEEKAETVETALQEQQPVLQEVSERALVCDDPTAPNHILIEGDNLHALTTLAYTHEGKIDMIYIDPPYNTGNKDFVYNDSFVDEADTFRHSKWLSFMAKRLRLSRRLLSERGVIFISIDDHEQAQLKLLCDQIFGEGNFINNFMWLHGKGKKDRWSRTLQQYIMAYAKDKEMVPEWMELKTCEYNFSNPDNDPKGDWFSGSISFNEERSNLNHKNYYAIKSPSGKIWLRQWMVPEAEMQTLIDEGDISFGPAPAYEGVPRRKIRRGDTIEAIPDNIFTDCNTTRGAENEVACIFGHKSFEYPKPVDLMKHILSIIQASPTATVLDFFAGSGTTMHAVMQLNAEDGGHRQCILVTNNENGICENITYERNKRVIQGYTKPNGDPVEGLHHNNLRYYRTVFVPRESSVANKQRLMDLSTDLLCIQNDLYTEQPVFGSQRFRSSWLRYFEQGDRRMLVVYDTRALERLIPELEQMEVAKPILVYIFSLTDDPASADFETVQSKVQLCALPEAILRAYKEVLPPKRTPAI